MKALRASLLPALAALAAVFMVLPTGGGDADIDMVAVDEAWAFTPADLEVDPGARIAFTNDSTVTHTATCVGCPWDTGDVKPGETVFLTFDDEAAYSFFCRYHGATLDMIGSLTVGDPPPAPAPSPTPTSLDGIPIDLGG